MLTLQLYLDGVWHDAAMLNVKAPSLVVAAKHYWLMTLPMQ